MDNKKIADFLLELRKQNNLTQKDISEICNISTQAVSKWERGESIPDISQLERLSNLYNVTINELINGESKKKEQFIVNNDITERQKLIFSLINSTLVFLTFAFNYIETEFTTGSSLPYFPIIEESKIIMRGYFLIFNGTGGAIVIILWFVFLTLLSHLVIHSLTLFGAVNRTKSVTTYLTYSSGVIALKAVICIFIPGYLFFPQLLLIIYSVISIILVRDKIKPSSDDLTENDNLGVHLKQYSVLYKEKMITDDLLLSEDIKRGSAFKTTILLYRLAITANLISLIIAFSSLVYFLMFETLDFNVGGIIITITLILTFLVLLYFYRFIYSIYLKNTIIIVNIVIFVATALLFIFVGYNYMLLPFVSLLITLMTLISSANIPSYKLLTKKS